MRASWPTVVIAVVAVLAGLIGNLTLENVEVFGTYLAAVASGVAIMFLRIPLMRLLLFVSGGIVDRVTRFNTAHPVSGGGRRAVESQRPVVGR